MDENTRRLMSAIITVAQSMLLMVVMGFMFIKIPNSVCCLNIVLFLMVAGLSFFCWDTLLKWLVERWSVGGYTAISWPSGTKATIQPIPIIANVNEWPYPWDIETATVIRIGGVIRSYENRPSNGKGIEQTASVGLDHWPCEQVTGYYRYQGCQENEIPICGRIIFFKIFREKNRNGVRVRVIIGSVRAFLSF